MPNFIVTETSGPINPGVPAWHRFQPGSVEYAEAYRAAADESLGPDAQEAARLAEIEAQQTKMQRAVEQTLASGTAPEGFAVVRHADADARTSAGEHLSDGFHLVPELAVEQLKAFGYSISSLPKAGS